MSPTGSRLLRAASRISAILERRAINKAHSEALKEYRKRDYDDYMDHIGGMRGSQNVSLAANTYATRTARREHLITDIKDIPDSIHRKVAGVGRAGIAIALGAGLAGANSAQRGYENAKQSAVKLNEAVGDGMMAAGARLEQGLDSAGQKTAETVESIKERLSKRREAAQERRATRRAKWSTRFDAIKQSVRSGTERLDHKTRAYRAAGEAAMAAYRSTIDAQKNPQ